MAGAVLAQWAGFVHPGLAVAAAAGGLVPIAIHLINRRRHRRIPWAAMAFLLAAQRKSRRRIFLEQWLLLAARVAVIVLLGLAVARPLMTSGALTLTGATRSHHVFLVDNSLSMNAVDEERGSSRFEAARRAAVEVLNSLPPADGVSVVTLAEPATDVLGIAAYDRRMIREVIESIRPTYRATDLAGALEHAKRILAGSPAAEGNRAVYFITDFAVTDWTPGRSPGPAAGMVEDMARTATPILMPIGARHAANAAITSAAPQLPWVGVGLPTRLNVEVANFGPALLPPQRLNLYRGDQLLRGVQTPAIEGGRSATVSMSVEFASPGSYRIRTELEPAGADALASDNDRYLSLDVRRTIPALLVDGRPGINALAGQAGYVATALAPRLSPNEPTLFQPKVITDLELSGEVLEDYDLVILCNVPRMAPPQWRRLEAYVREGGGLVTCLGDLVSADNYARHGYGDGGGVLPARPAETTSAGGADAAGVGLRLDEHVHPMVSEFEAQPGSGLFRARTLRYVRVDATQPDAQVVLRYDNGEAALIAGRCGAGRTALWTSTANMDWTNLPAKGDFVPLMINLAGHVTRRQGAHRTLTVGQAWVEPLSAAEASLPLQAIATDGSAAPARVEAQNGALSLVADPPPLPGFGAVRVGPREAVFAVNVDTRDCDLEALPPDRLRAMLGPFVRVIEPGDYRVAGTAIAARNELATVVLVAVVVLIFLELTLAVPAKGE